MIEAVVSRAGRRTLPAFWFVDGSGSVDRTLAGTERGVIAEDAMRRFQLNLMLRGA